MGSIIGFLGQWCSLQCPRCHLSSFWAGTGGQCCIPASSRETGAVRRVLPRHAGPRGVIQPGPSCLMVTTALPPFRPPARAIDPNACCSSSSCRLRQETCGGAGRPGRAKQEAPLSAGPDLGEPGQAGQARLGRAELSQRGGPVYKTIVTPRLYFRILLAVNPSPSPGRTLPWTGK